MAEGGSVPSYWTVRRLVKRGVDMHFQELDNRANKSPCRDTNLQTANLSNQTLHRDLDDSDHGVDDETIRQATEHVEHFVDSGKSDDGDDLLELENRVNLVLSDTDTNSSSDDELGNVLENLKDWTIANHVTDSSTSKLLKILRPLIPSLPKDPRTLKKTKTQYTIVEKCGGEYFYFGIVSCIRNQMKNCNEFIPDGFVFSLQINVDGLPLFKSTNHQLWPISGLVQNIPKQSPFIIALFSGSSKPTDIHEYFRDFVEEYHNLHDGFDCCGKLSHVALHSIVCDTPARAFVKQVKSYSGYHGCDRCNQNGVWLGKMTFPETEADLRTDALFDEMRDEEHHLGPTPLSHLHIGMITQIPLDYMHLVCLGVLKRILLMWMKGPLTCRLGLRSLQQISERLIDLKCYIPSEFARKPRSLFEVQRWKATEFRQFLLYTGTVVLSGAIHPNLYKNFLLLSVSMHILLNETLSKNYNAYANDLLVAFVKHFYEIYGKNMAVYNVHCLIHLAADAGKFGSLNNISSFPFENFLHQLKRMVRKPSFPLSQIIRRLSEEESYQSERKAYPILTKSHSKGPLPNNHEEGTCTQFSKIEMEKYLLKLNVKDNCVRINGRICLIKNILLGHGGIYLVFQSFKKSEDFFTSPLSSRLLGISVAFDLEHTLKTEKLSSVEAKCVLLPMGKKYVALPYTDATWSKTYAVVEFPEEEEVDVVPLKWLTENEKLCRWPPMKSTKNVQLAVKNAINPTADFRKLPVRVLYKASDYEKARKKLKLAEVTSDLQTDAEEASQANLGKRNKKPNPRYESETEDEVDEPIIRRKSPRKKTCPPAPIIPEPPSTPVIARQASLPPLPTLFSTPSPSSTSAFERKLISTIKEVKVQAKLNTSLLQKISKRIDVLDKEEHDDDEGADECNIDLPLVSKEDVMVMEGSLKTEKTFKRMVKSLRTIGGENLKGSVRRLLSHIFTNSLARQINWIGKGEKLALSNLKLKDLIFATVRKNPICINATDVEISGIARDWFRYAGDRDGGRKLREERKKQQQKEKQQENTQEPAEE